MKNIICVGDLHLGGSLSLGKQGIGSTLNSRITDQINILDWVLEEAIENQACIIITGDIFEDPKPHPTIITIFISWLKKCESYNIPVHIIYGNHDILRSGFVTTSSLDIISEIELHNIFTYKETETIYINNTSVTLMPFKDRKSFSVNSAKEALDKIQSSLDWELASIPSHHNKIIIGHFAIEGSIPVGNEIDDLTNELFCPLSMFDGFDYIWMGHVHKPQILKKNPYIAHIGSMDISNFGETDHNKHIVIIDTDNPKDWKSKNIPTRNLKKITVSIPKDTIDPTEFVLNHLKTINNFDKSIVKVEISLQDAELSSVNKSTIERYLSSQGVFNIASIIESKKVNLIKKDSNNVLDTKMDINSAIKKYSEVYIDKDQQSEFIDLSLSIYKQFLGELK